MIESKEPAPVTLTIEEMRPSPDQMAYTYDDLATLLKVAKQTVMEWVKRGKVPSPIYFGSTARFTREQVDTMMKGPQKPGTFEVAESPRSEAATLARVKKVLRKPSPAKGKGTPKQKSSTNKKPTKKPAIKRATRKGGK